MHRPASVFQPDTAHEDRRGTLNEADRIAAYHYNRNRNNTHQPINSQKKYSPSFSFSMGGPHSSVDKGVTAIRLLMNKCPECTFSPT